MLELAMRKDICVTIRDLHEENPDNKPLERAYITAQMDVLELEYKSNLRKIT